MRGQPRIVQTLAISAASLSGKKRARLADHSRMANSSNHTMTEIELIVLSGTDGEIARHRFGPATACDVTIKIGPVSRQHARVVVAENGSVQVEDLASANGTLLDGGPVGEMTTWRSGQVLSVGDVTLELRGGDARSTLRFIEEAQVTAQLEHPNVVPVHDLGIDAQGQPFYTMKMVEGITLKKVLELLREGVHATVEKYPLGTLLTDFQKVSDMRPLAGMRLRSITCDGLKQLKSLAGLEGAPLEWVSVWGAGVTDLSSLHNCPLRELRIVETRITNLSAVRDCPLDSRLLAQNSALTSIEALRGKRVKTVHLYGCEALTDITPLKDCSTMDALTLPPHAKDIAFLRQMPNLRYLSCKWDKNEAPDKTVAEFWAEYDAKQNAAPK